MVLAPIVPNLVLCSSDETDRRILPTLLTWGTSQTVVQLARKEPAWCHGWLLLQGFLVGLLLKSIVAMMLGGNTSVVLPAQYFGHRSKPVKEVCLWTFSGLSCWPWP